jgi:hypothetical protein
MIGRMVERWGLVFGTWLLAVATIWLAWDAKWSSKEQLRAYLYVNPGELYHIDGKGVLQVYSNIGNSGQTPAENVERFAQIEVLPPTENPSAAKRERWALLFSDLERKLFSSRIGRAAN